MNVSDCIKMRRSIRKYKPDHIDHSIIEAGNLCHTSKSAMLRFAKKLGYRGYSEFKYAIEESTKKDLEATPLINHNETILHQISSSFALKF